MSKTARAQAIRDTVGVIFGLTIAIVLLLWAAWEVDFSLNRQTFIRIVSAFILLSFVLFLVLFVTLVYVERTNHYAHERTSRIHLPLIISTGALLAYFGIASISAIDVFYEPPKMWPLLRDPTVQLLTASIIIVVAGAKMWMLYEILPTIPWIRRNP